MLSWRNKKNIYLIPSSYLEIGQRLSPASKSIAPDKQSWDFLYFSMKTDAVGIHKKHFNELRCFQWVPTTCFFLWRNNFMTKVMAPLDKVFFFLFFFLFFVVFFFFQQRNTDWQVFIFHHKNIFVATHQHYYCVEVIPLSAHNIYHNSR